MKYYDEVQNIMAYIASIGNTLKDVAKSIANAIEDDRLVHLIPADMHSTAPAEDLFFKVGSPCAYNLVTDPTFHVNHLASRAYYLRNARNIGRFLVQYYRNIKQGDAALLFSQSSHTSVHEMIDELKIKGVATFLVTTAKDDFAAHQTVAIPAQSGSISNIALLVAGCYIDSEVSALLGGKTDFWLPFSEENNAKNEMLIKKYKHRIKQL